MIDTAVTPCLRCGDKAPLTIAPRNELLFYTARMSVAQYAGDACATQVLVDVDQEPRGRLCEACTRAFADWVNQGAR